MVKAVLALSERTVAITTRGRFKTPARISPAHEMWQGKPESAVIMYWRPSSRQGLAESPTRYFVLRNASLEKVSAGSVWTAADKLGLGCLILCGVVLLAALGLVLVAEILSK